MKKKFSEKTKREQIIDIARWVLQILVLIVFAYVIFLRIKAGQHIPMPLIGCVLLVLLGITRIISAHDRHQGSGEERKKFNKIVIRSVILAPIIVAVFLTVVVLIKLKT